MRNLAGLTSSFAVPGSCDSGGASEVHFGLMNRINCRDFDTAIASLTCAMGQTTSALSEALQWYNESRLHESRMDPFEKMPNDILAMFGLDLPTVVSRTTRTTYFHATRVTVPELFHTAGILPLPDAVEAILIQLRSLAGTAISDEDWLEAIESLTSRPMASDAHTLALRLRYQHLWGPSGALVRDRHLLAGQLGLASFQDRPEIVVDIANAIETRTDIPLLEMFLSETTPCIVEFKSTCIGPDEIRSAFWYVYSIARSMPLTNIEQGSFDGHGHPVPASDVVSVATIDSRAA